MTTDRFHSRSAKWQSRCRARHGGVLICVVVCLSIVVAMLAAMTQASLRLRRQTDKELWSQQVEWLLIAGRERAEARLRESPDFAGEIWLLDKDRLAGMGPAEVRITTMVEEPDAERRVRIVAILPSDAPHSVRRTEEFIHNAKTDFN